jgi:hypothetical protein
MRWRAAPKSVGRERMKHFSHDEGEEKGQMDFVLMEIDFCLWCTLLIEYLIHFVIEIYMLGDFLVGVECHEFLSCKWKVGRGVEWFSKQLCEWLGKQNEKDRADAWFLQERGIESYPFHHLNQLPSSTFVNTIVNLPSIVWLSLSAIATFSTPPSGCSASLALEPKSFSK